MKLQTRLLYSKFLLICWTLCVVVLFSASFEKRLAFAVPGDVINTFINPDMGVEDLFGSSVAFVGNNILVGAPEDPASSAAKTGGMAYLFDGNDSSLLHTFTDPETGFENFFGFAVAGLGSNVLIGAPLDDFRTLGGDGPVGSVYLFDGFTGDLIRKFTDDSLRVSANFGWSIATIDGNVIVGVPGQSDVGGEVFLYDGNGNLLKKFQQPGPNLGRRFGQSVVAAGKNILINSRSNLARDSVGEAYLFDGDPASPTFGDLLQTFSNPTPADDDGNSSSVASIGSVVALSLPFDDTMGQDAGAVYLFDGDPSSPTFGDLLKILFSPTPGRSDQFGFSVTDFGKLVLIGEPDPLSAPGPGTAYLFDADPSSPTFGNLLQTILNPDPNISDLFGSAVAAGGPGLLIGAPRDDAAAIDAGAAYLIEPIPEPSTMLLLASGLAGLAAWRRRKAA